MKILQNKNIQQKEPQNSSTNQTEVLLLILILELVIVQIFLWLTPFC